MITKTKFLEIRTKCPWYANDNGHPVCAAIHSFNRRYHCSKKNCAIVYWIKQDIQTIGEEETNDN
jgi:hypothetical protein